MKVKLEFFAACLIVGSAAAQSNGTGQIRNIAVAAGSGSTQVQINVSTPVQPKVIVATNPPRLVLEFAGVLPGKKQAQMAVGQDGIESIRVGLHSARPPVTRVVIKLDSARPYQLTQDGNLVVLTVLRGITETRSHNGSGAPSAAGVPLFGRLHRPKHKTPSVADQVTPGPVPPAPRSEPIIITDAGVATRQTSTEATRPTAVHPNFGSLQEGTVFPGTGAPGTGVVPHTVTSNSGSNDQQSSVAAANKSTEQAVAQPIISGPPSQTGSEGSQPQAATPAAAQKITVTAPLQASPGITTTAQRVVNSAPVSLAPAPTAANESSPTSPAAGVSEQVTSAASSAQEPDVSMPVLATRQPNADLRTAFKVKYVAEGAAYLDAGRSSGLSEGMKLEIHDTDPSTAKTAASDAQGIRVAAMLKVISVAETSAVAEISEPKRDVVPGDLAYLSSEDTETIVAQRSLSPTRKYPAVISFTEGDPLEEEAHDEVPRPPLPEVNRARGRIGFDYSGIVSHGQFASTSSNFGMVVRTDMTRIGGSYWNLSGYWRGRFTSNSSATQPTLQDLINRTYTIGLTYDNPKSPWAAGVGRLYLPWATSLDTIDGGYIARKVSPIATVGLFAGSTPDPTSWSYAPDQQMSGMFVNFQGGSFDDFRYSSTSGMGIQMLKWKIDRPFVFFENGLYYKRYFSLYSAVQADKPASNPAVPAPGAGISRSFTTLRIQPTDRFEFDVNHTYFRDVPNFDPQLIGTGLLDKYLFQGFSAGPRIEVYKQIWVYATLGRSNRSGEAKSSLNQLYGITFGDLPFRFHADIRYSRFNSAFGDGDYKAVSLSRNFHDSYRWEVLVGQQSYSSMLAASDRSKFVNANIEAPLGPHYFIQGGWTVNRGGTLNYDQWFTTFGYRFDSWHRGAK
jgi:AMIN domain-containing protein